jgi:NTP pyrophosphatase (non-canonical NTP hydrolase)
MNKEIDRSVAVTISGSFRKFYPEITNAIDVFSEREIEVLSPAKSKIVDPSAEFVIFESDETTDVKELEDKHLDAISNSDALYVINPGGYVGNSAILEIGYAIALGIPIYTSGPIEDQTLAAYIDGITGPEEIDMKQGKTDKLELPANPKIKDFQEYVHKMVVERGFDKETPKDILILLTEEWGELARAVRKAEGLKMADDTERARIAEELADCFIYLLDIANQYNINLEKAFREKEEKNKQREWK